jgi:hypothetical protein
LITLLLYVLTSPGSEGMPMTLSSSRDGHRSADENASGDRLRRQMDYSEDETIVVDVPESYASTDDEPYSADGNLTLRFGYAGYQPPAQTYMNPYGGMI